MFQCQSTVILRDLEQAVAKEEESKVAVYVVCWVILVNDINRVKYNFSFTWVILQL